MMGFGIIGEMTKDELIAEIIDHQREVLQALEPAQLKATVIDFRVSAVRARLNEEAGITITPGMFGATITDTEDD